VDFYTDNNSHPETIEIIERIIREQFTKWFPCGVVEGYPDVYDQDEMRAKIETPFS